MACKTCNGNDPYKSGGPYSPGNPYCPSCNPYNPYAGPGQDPNAPTNAGCVPDNTDPCATRDVQTQPCHNGVCDDRFADLPTSKRITLFGVIGRCFYRFASGLNGFIVNDDAGASVTNRPCVKIPFLKSYLTNPATGAVLTDNNGEALEGPVPEFDSLIAADSCGCQNRIQGTKGKMQTPLWNGTSYEFIEYVERDENPLLNPEDVPIIDSDTCPEPLLAVLVPSSRTVAGQCGTDETEYGYVLGGTRNLGAPVGAMEMWAGRDDNVPSGWLIADGSLVAVDDYPALFQSIGYGWGGDGGSNFNLPDMRGRFVRGVDMGVGNDPDADTRITTNIGGNTGDNVGTLQEDQMQCFSATYSRFSLSSISVKQATAGSSLSVARFQNNYTNTPISFVDGGCGEPRFGQETRPANVYVYYIIRTGCPPVVTP